ncbi:MAG: acyl-CoA dehydrogenase family protein [Acidimicrobiales bacterium]
MEFGLDPAQVELQQTVERFFADRFPLDGVGDREGVPVDRGTWGDLAAMGLFGLVTAEDAGGSGLGVLEAALTFEQVGSYLVPGPLLWTVLAAPLVDGAVSGDRIVGGIEAGSIDDGSAAVEHAPDLDVLLVVEDDRVIAHRTTDLAPPEPLASLDPLTPVGRFVGLGGGEVVSGADAAAELRRRGTVLAAAVLVGVASRALETARAYALERHQFDVPIGSFQAIKHLLADMYVATSLAQSSTYGAAAVLDDPRADDPGRSAGSAKLLAADAAINGAGTAVQVLGGMGFTWAMLPHYLLKRAWVLEQSFGSADDHALRLGSILVPSP